MTKQQNYGAELAARLKTPVSQWLDALASSGRRLRVAMPGLIVSFDPVKQTAVVQPALTELERIAGVLTTKILQPLVDIPIVLPRAGGYTLTLPVQAGDECLVVFGDSCMDAWHQSGGQQNEWEQRRHSLADGFAILGPWSNPRVLANYSTVSAQLRNDAGTVTVDVAASQVTVTAPTVQVNGTTVNVTGSSQVNISGSGNTTIEGRNFLTHHHSGVQTGSSSSGPVV